MRCIYCGKECKNANSHRNHERCCPENPNRNYKNNSIGHRGANQFTKAREEGRTIVSKCKGRPGSFTGKKHTKETKQKISKALSKNNHGGRCKWYRVSGVYVQGTWERDLAKKMNELNIPWEKIKTNSFTFKYIMNGRIRHYTPDFKVNELLLELKGYWWGDDKEKMRLVQEQNKLPDLRIIEKELYQKLLSTSSDEEFLKLVAVAQLVEATD